MIDQPAAPDAGPPSEPSGPITLRNLFLPWTELLATGVPPEQLTTDLHVQLALAALVGQSNGIGRLVQINDDGTISTKLTAPAQAGPDHIAQVNVDVAAGATVPLLIGIPDVTVFLWGGWFEHVPSVAASTWQIRRVSDGVQVFRARTELSIGRVWSPNGIQLPKSDGVEIHNNSGTLISIAGWVTWSTDPITPSF